MTCTHCHGEGEGRARVYGIRNGRHFCEWRLLRCSFCGGLGTMDEGQAAAEERGRRLQQDRVARGVSLREEAQRLGVSPRELSDREWGRS